MQTSEYRAALQRIKDDVDRPVDERFEELLAIISQLPKEEQDHAIAVIKRVLKVP